MKMRICIIVGIIILLIVIIVPSGKDFLRAVLSRDLDGEECIDGDACLGVCCERTYKANGCATHSDCFEKLKLQLSTHHDILLNKRTSAGRPCRCWRMNTKSLLLLLLPPMPAFEQARGGPPSTTSPSTSFSGIATLIRNRPRELLLTIMGVRTGGANNSFLLRFLAAALLSFLFSKLPNYPPQITYRKEEDFLGRLNEARACTCPLTFY